VKHSRQLFLPVLGQLARCLGDGINIVGQSQSDHVGLQAVDDRAGLLTRATMRLVHLDVVAGLAFQCLAKAALKFA